MDESSVAGQCAVRFQRNLVHERVQFLHTTAWEAHAIGIGRERPATSLKLVLPLNPLGAICHDRLHLPSDIADATHKRRGRESKRALKHTIDLRPAVTGLVCKHHIRSLLDFDHISHEGAPWTRELPRTLRKLVENNQRPANLERLERGVVFTLPAQMVLQRVIQRGSYDTCVMFSGIQMSGFSVANVKFFLNNMTFMSGFIRHGNWFIDTNRGSDRLDHSMIAQRFRAPTSFGRCDMLALTQLLHGTRHRSHANIRLACQGLVRRIGIQDAGIREIFAIEVSANMKSDHLCRTRKFWIIENLIQPHHADMGEIVTHGHHAAPHRPDQCPPCTLLLSPMEIMPAPLLP